tara:strand:- start:429 stop:2144 length:1716 start_codon:yes stop_codon:yes gene_type:complete
MKLIDKEKFLEYKKSDTLVIWGPGSSINNLEIKDFDYLHQFDSISTTMFAKSKIKTTYYIIGEVLFNYYRAIKKGQKCDGKSLDELYKTCGESPHDYISLFNNCPDTCFIIWNDDYTLNKKHFNELDKLENDYILVKQYGHDPFIDKSNLKIDKTTEPKPFVDKELYSTKLLLEDKILLHQWKGINAPIYFAKCMDYKKIIFVGIDLTVGIDSYAFDRNEFIKNISSKIHKSHIDNNVHPCKDILFKFINYLKSDIEFTTYTPSLLEEIIPLNKINKNLICSVVNSTYFIGGVILLYSLKKHNMYNNDIIIFYSSLTEGSDLKKEHRLFISKYFSNVNFVDVTKEIYLKYKDKYEKMFTAFLCLEAILNENVCKYDKVCFLDSDMILLNNINFIFDKMDVFKLNGSSNDCPHFNFYRGNDHKNMINTGFMVYDTKIRNKLSTKIIDFMNNSTEKDLPQWDQSIINKSLKNEFVNNMDWFCNYKPSPNELKENKWNIIHYAGKIKPWDCFQSRKNHVNRNETFEMYKHIIYEWFKYVKELSIILHHDDNPIYFEFLKNNKMLDTWNTFDKEN